jgi:hypothetical protein
MALLAILLRFSVRERFTDFTCFRAVFGDMLILPKPEIIDLVFGVFVLGIFLGVLGVEGAFLFGVDGGVAIYYTVNFLV